MKVNLKRLKRCEACGEWKNGCIEYNGEILCPECLEYEKMYEEKRAQDDAEMTEVFNRCDNETY